jgi:translation initiation factor 1
MKKRNRSNSGDDRENEEAAPAAAAAPKGPFNNPFAAALKDHPVAASGGAEPVKASGADTKRVPAPARAVVRIERKGHGGKDVTVVEQLGLNERDLERWMKSFKQSLGCGGSVEGGSILLQGDHRERLRQLLTERGVKKISVG